LFTNNFRATCTWPGVDWDLASVVQKKEKSLWEYIQHFCNKSNVIPEVNDKSIMMFFKKGLREPSLIQKLAMKNPRMSEEMFSSPIDMPQLRRRPSTAESRRRSRATRISLAHPRAMTRRENWTVLSMR
jgi:hypothetical protein